MSSSTRKEHQRLKKKLKVGDYVTWGLGIISHKVVEIKGDGVKVDVTDDPRASQYCGKREDGKYYHFVAFASRGESDLRIVDGKFNKR